MTYYRYQILLRLICDYLLFDLIFVCFASKEMNEAIFFGVIISMLDLTPDRQIIGNKINLLPII